MKNEKLSEVVKTIYLMARYGIQKKYPSGDTETNNIIKHITLLKNKLIPILADLEAVEN